MSDEADKIKVWIPGTGEIISKRFHGWWIKYPKPGSSKMISEPPETSSPIFKVGDYVRLNGKPERVRKVLAVEWHCHRYEFVYIVEVSGSVIFGYYSSPYWFASQLSPAAES